MEYSRKVRPTPSTLPNPSYTRPERLTLSFSSCQDEKTSEIVKMATPLLLCLCVIELSDVVFAVDSIPAVFGVTQDPLIVYSSNIFAILGLRSLYAFVATLVSPIP